MKTVNVKVGNVDLHSYSSMQSLLEDLSGLHNITYYCQSFDGDGEMYNMVVTGEE